MTDLAVWPDVEIVARQALLDLCDSIGTETPADPTDALSWLPFVRLQCIGGSDDRITDRSRLAVDTFASTKVAASLLARQLQQRLISSPLHVPGTGVVDLGETTSKPQAVPWTSSPPPWRYTATYQLFMRRL